MPTPHTQPLRGAIVLLGVLALAALSAPAQDPPAANDTRPFDQRHLDFHLAIDFEREHLTGRASLTLAALRDGLLTLRLDAKELTVTGAWVGDAPATFAQAPGRLVVVLPQPLDRGEEVTVTLAWETSPREGFHFVQADPDGGEAWRHAYSQGQLENNSYWLPCRDRPDDCLTVAAHVTVPADAVALSNGHQVGVTDGEDGRRTWHWRTDTPLVPYLIAVVAGDFEPLRGIYRDTPLTVWAPPGRADEARAILTPLPEMLAFLENTFGTPFPWPRYDQVVVHRFHWGGMENATLTTLNDRMALARESAVRCGDADPDILVVHELAHQWFGDLVTCRQWGHVWLHEGFATYAEHLWREHRGGINDLRWHLQHDRTTFADADRRHPQPILVDTTRPDDALFDGRRYEKGAWVLHMLRGLVGDATFQAILHETLAAYADTDTNILTADLRAVAERVAERDLGWFFDQWLRRPGWPVINATWETDDDATVRLRLRQRNVIPRLLTPYRLEFPVDLAWTDGTRSRHRIILDADEGTFGFTIPAGKRLARVVVDPGHTLLRDLWMDQPDKAWREQLDPAREPDVLARWEAVRYFADQALALGADTPAWERLWECASADPYPPLRASCLRQIAAVLHEAEGDVPPWLPGRLHARYAETTDPAEREALLRLGGAGPPSWLPLLRDAATGPQLSATVWAAAIDALAAQWARGNVTLNAPDRALLDRLLDTTSHDEEVRRAALRAWCRLLPEEGMPLAIALAAGTAPYPLRSEAVAIGADRWLRSDAPSAIGALFRETLLGDADWRLRRQAVWAIANQLPGAGDAWATPLRAALSTERNPRVQTALREAIPVVAGEQHRKIPGHPVDLAPCVGRFWTPRVEDPSIKDLVLYSPGLLGRNRR